MKGNRRKFIKGLAASSLILPYSYASDGISRREELLNLLKTRGYDESNPDSVLLAIISDPHIFLGYQYPQYRTEKFDDRLVDEINSLSPLVSELVIAGDIITYHSMSPGLPDYASHRIFSKDEYDLAKPQIARFNFSCYIIPGNHDTTAHEEDAEMFRAELQVPAYQKTTMAGVVVFLLNSGNAGMLDSAQEAWFRFEASKIEGDQEVLIIVHIPPLTQKWTQAGVKRIITESFQNHKSTIWVVSGHNHRFAERKFMLEGVSYIQTDTTSASAVDWAFGDDLNPGYLILALQDGKVLSRVFRSINEAGFQLRPLISELPELKVSFMFDEISFPSALYEEGFYDHQGKVIDYNAVHVGSFFARCKKIIIRVNPEEYLGKIDFFIVSGYILGSATPLCSFSLSPEDDAWTAVSFPDAKGNGLYHVSIPDEFKNAGVYFVKLDNGLTGSTQGFKMSGWALMAETDSLTGYEKWISSNYRNLEKSDKTDSESITHGSSYSNIINFAFNLMPIDSEGLSGLPKVECIPSSPESDEYISLTFAKMKTEYNPGISYDLERSYNMKDWHSISENQYEEIILKSKGQWDEVRYRVTGGIRSSQFFRINLSLL